MYCRLQNQKDYCQIANKFGFTGLMLLPSYKDARQYGHFPLQFTHVNPKRIVSTLERTQTEYIINTLQRIPSYIFRRSKETPHKRIHHHHWYLPKEKDPSIDRFFSSQTDPRLNSHAKLTLHICDEWQLHCIVFSELLQGELHEKWKDNDSLLLSFFNHVCAFIANLDEKQRILLNPYVACDLVSSRSLGFLVALAKGIRVEDIAEQEGIRPSTVQYHIKRCLANLGINSKRDIARFVFKQGLA